MIDGSRLKGLRVALVSVLVVFGLAAIPAASADTTTTQGATATGCATILYQDGGAQQVPGLTVTTGETQAQLLQALVAVLTPAQLQEPTTSIATIEPGCASATSSSATTTTSTTPPSSTTGTAPATTDPTSTPTSGSTSPTTTSSPTVTAPTSGPTTTTAPSTTTTGPTPPDKPGTGTGTKPPPVRPGAPSSERSGSKAPAAAKHRRKTAAHEHHKSRRKTTSDRGGAPVGKKMPKGKGVPNPNNPTLSVSLPGAPPVGVPNFFIDSFQIPPFLLPIYQAAGIEYQVPWQVLAAINEIETDYGRNLSVSSAGAVGWMQFLPSTWKQWGVDATGDGIADPYNPVDAIFTAARYLHAAGASQNLSQAIFAYNHAGWYVSSVLLRAKLIGGIPSGLIGALTGLVEGHFPVAAAAEYADDSVVALAKHRVKGSNAAITVGSDRSNGTAIFAKRGSPVIAANDGKIIKLGSSPTLGNYIELQDATGNIYTYSQLGSVSKLYPVPKPVTITKSDKTRELATTRGKRPASAPSVTDPKVGTIPASAGVQSTSATASAGTPTAPTTSAASAGSQPKPKPASGPTSSSSSPSATIASPLPKERLFAHPADAASYAAGGKSQLSESAQITSFNDFFADTLHLAKDQYTLQRLKVGAIVVAGTILGRLGGPSQGVSSHLYFQIQPAGHDAPDIDPKPILDGWKLLQATAVYRANGIDPFYGPNAKNPTIGQVLLMSKQQLEERVLTDPRVQVYNCGRRDIEAGTIDRRVLAVIEFLSASGLDPDVSGLACGASLNGATGVDLAGKTGESVDISKINGIPVQSHTGPGSITDQAIRRLLTLQGSMQPAQIISAISYRDQPSTLALPNHRNRIQITFTPEYGRNSKLSKQLGSILKPGQWIQLINRISQIPEPVVPITPSRYSIRTPGR